MTHFLGGAVSRLRKPVAVVAVASGLMGGAFVFGASSTAGGAMAFSGPQPPDQYLTTLVDTAVAVVGAVPSYVSIALEEATIVVNETQAQVQQGLGAL